MREMKKATRVNEPSEALLGLYVRLEQLGKSKNWLALSLDPPVSRQAVTTWHDVPIHYVEQVADLLKVDPARVRPDLARIFGVEPERAVA